MIRTHEGSDVSPLARIDWTAITRRPPFAVDEAAVQRRVHGHGVLITGAAGSLGAPLAHSLAAAGPAKLVLYDQHESSLFRLRQALAAAVPGLVLHAVLADVREPRRLRRVMGEVRPDLIFHLAAYKHVPWGEEDPESFAATNVLGARHVIDAARESGVAQIVYPSTDKAISPPSLYGATKRLSEAMLRATAMAGGPRSVIVRFVNVLGSQGSTTETFARQIRAGQALTITDPLMRRYWITPQHANLLLLHAACLGGPEEPALTVAPDAGDEITIMDIARRLWSALTPALVPTSPEQRGEPAITITGPRPGERLAEPL
ncbi:MAG: polysaccharide biosynthesis protein, partial [Chloroflexota bacterium]|nr:polysaccharide biosynthesis protein [Chloroflexota bacterium]